MAHGKDNFSEHLRKLNTTSYLCSNFNWERSYFSSTLINYIYFEQLKQIYRHEKTNGKILPC